MDDTNDQAVASRDNGEGNHNDVVIDAEVVASFVEPADEGTLVHEEMRVCQEDDAGIAVNEDSLDRQSARSDRCKESEECSFKGACEPADSSGPDSQLEPIPLSHSGGDKKKDDESNTADDESRGNLCGGTSSGKSDIDTDSAFSSVSKRKRGGALYSPGTRVEAQDFQEKWYPAKVLKVDEEDGDVLIHFEGWSSRYDEWVSMDSPRLRFASQQQTRKTVTRRSNKKASYKKGEEVLARWADGRKYAAKILEVNDDDTYNVLFYDGFEKRVKWINVERMPLEQKGAVTFPKSPPKDHSAHCSREQQPETKSSQLKQEQRRPSKEMQSETKAFPAETELKRSEPKKACPPQSGGVTKPKDHKRVSKADGCGKKSEKRDGSTSSSTSSSSQNRKKILLVGGKFMAKRDNSQEIKAKRKQEVKKEGLKRKRGLSGGDGPAGKRERKGSFTNNDSSSSRSAPTSLPSTPAEHVPTPPDCFSSVAPKEFIIEEDHNHFKCTYEGCNKSFRKEPLLQSHLKHYHGATSPASAAAPSKRRSSDVALGHATALLERVADTKQTISQCMESLQPVEKDTSMGEAPVGVSDSEDGAICPPVTSGPSESGTVGGQAEQIPLVDLVLPPDTAVALSTTVTATAVVDTATVATSALATPTAASVEGTDSAVCLPAGALAEGLGPLTVAPDGTPAQATPPVHKAPRRMRIVPHFESLVQGREKRKIAKTEKALIADMEAAASRRGSHSDRKRKRTSSTRSDKSEEGQTKPTTSKEGRRMKTLEAAHSPLSMEPHLSNEDVTETPVPHHKGKRRRHLLPSTSDSSLSSFSEKFAKEFQSHDQDHARSAGAAGVSSDERVRCACNCEEESGLMMQCEVCLTWQHGTCFNIEEEKDVPDKYICYSCLSPRAKTSRLPKIQDRKEFYSGVRESFRYKHDQDWFTQGEMASFSFLKEKMATNPRPEPVKATHDLMVSMHNVFAVLRGITHKLNIAGQEDHPDLKHFAKPWVEGEPTEGDAGGKSSEMTAGEMTDFSRPGRDIMVSPYDHTYFGQPECSNGVQEAPDVVVTSLEEPPEEILVQDMDGLEVGCVEEVAAPRSEEALEIDVVACEEEVIAASEEDATSFCAPSVSPEDVAEVSPVMPPVVEAEEKVDPELCKKNLLNHIFSIQDQLEQKLTSMEEQLQILENETNEGTSNPGLSEEEEVLKLRLSLKGLMKDLNAVHRLSMFQ